MAYIKKPISPKSKETTKEENLKLLLQKRVALAEGILLSLCQSCGRDLFWDKKNEDAKDIHVKMVNTAVEMADALMEKLFVTKE